MVDIESYLSDLITALQAQFPSRLLYVGLQGSYLRGEATYHSDIDIMVVIEDLNVSDLKQYRMIVKAMEDCDKSCGFICGKSDLANWNPLEVHHLLNTTKDYFGVLRDLVPNYTELDIRNFVKLSVNNLYHEICHRYVHAERNAGITELSGSYKAVFFILQNLYYLRHGKFVTTKAELLSLLNNNDLILLKRSIELNQGIEHDFLECFSLLFTWCQETLLSL